MIDEILEMKKVVIRAFTFLKKLFMNSCNFGRFQRKSKKWIDIGMNEWISRDPGMGLGNRAERREERSEE